MLKINNNKKITPSFLTLYTITFRYFTHTHKQHKIKSLYSVNQGYTWRRKKKNNFLKIQLLKADEGIIVRMDGCFCEGKTSKLKVGAYNYLQRGHALAKTILLQLCIKKRSLRLWSSLFLWNANIVSIILYSRGGFHCMQAVRHFRIHILGFVLIRNSDTSSSKIM